MFLRNLLGKLRRRRFDDHDFQEEIRSHLAMSTRDRIERGMDPEEARYSSRRELGNLTLAAEDSRRVWTPRWLEHLLSLCSDFRFAMRTLSGNPAFAITVIVVLTLGIGLNSAAFTMLKGIALTPLAGVERATDIAVVFGQAHSGRALRLSYPDYVDLRDNSGSFVELFGTALGSVNLGRGRNARPISSELVTGNYFQVLGVRAQLGRTLQPSDEVAPGRHPIVVLSDGLWRRDFGAAPDIVGRTVVINNYPLTVVGVSEPAFYGTIVSYEVEAFIPVMAAPLLGFNFGSQETTPSGILGDRAAAVFMPHGFLRPGSTIESAEAEVSALWSAAAAERPVTEAGRRMRIVPFLQAPGTGPTYILPTLIALSTMGLLVLLIACANIAGLVLVRGVSRRGEIAVRLALGAGRARLVRLLIIESLTLAVPGATLGVLLSWYGIPPLVAYAEWLAAPQRIFLNVNVDLWVIGFAALVAGACATVFGLVPALQSSKLDLVSVINTDSSQRSLGRSRFRSGLVVAQVAVSLVLLVGTGLAFRSVEAARSTDPGFDPDHVASVAIDVRQNGYDRRRGRAFYKQLIDHAKTLPGVETVSLAAFHPLAVLDTPALRLAVEGYQPDRDEDLTVLNNIVGPDYFQMLRVPILAGREFSERDDEAATPVAVVNHTLAERFWGSASNAIGKRIRAGSGDWRTVVGVAADLKYLTINERPRLYFYLPFFQSYRSTMVLQIRGRIPVDQLVDQGRATVEAIDPDLPLLYARPAVEELQGSMIFLDLTATMLLAFGLTGLALAAIGTYGLVSYTVRNSEREIGVRMALGASSRTVVRDVVWRGLRLGGVGVVAGLLAGIGVTTLLRGLLYGVSATDVPTFAAALAIVLAVVILATLVPAWRASQTNPLTALRRL